MALILQDEVTGIMISEFVSREFGYGLALTDEDLVRVSKSREENEYSDMETARNKMGNSKN